MPQFYGPSLFHTFLFSDNGFKYVLHIFIEFESNHLCFRRRQGELRDKKPSVLCALDVMLLTFYILHVRALWLETAILERPVRHYRVEWKACAVTQQNEASFSKY